MRYGTRHVDASNRGPDNRAPHRRRGVIAAGKASRFIRVHAEAVVQGMFLFSMHLLSAMTPPLLRVTVPTETLARRLLRSTSLEEPSKNPSKKRVVA